jgi:pimeloyl-ACP methyl ester carboxylesterase
VRALLTAETTKFQYTHGAKNPDAISPDSYTFDQHFLDHPRNGDIQLDLFYDYRSNVARYDEWRSYFRKHQPPMLIVWGRNDPFFAVEGARSFQRDLPKAELHLLDGGHFALEEHSQAIADHMARFLGAAAERSRGAKS